VGFIDPVVEFPEPGAYIPIQGFIGEFQQDFIDRMLAEIGFVMVFAGGAWNHFAEGLVQLNKGTAFVVLKEGEGNGSHALGKTMKKRPEDWTPFRRIGIDFRGKKA
jgi:hypothetical protein